MTALQFIEKCNFIDLVIGGFSAEELKRQADNLGIKLSNDVANKIATHYKQNDFGINENQEFTQTLETIELEEK